LFIRALTRQEMPPLKEAAVIVALLCIAIERVDAQEKKPPPPTEFSTDVGFVSVSGNTSTITVQCRSSSRIEFFRPVFK
jgi:hypothetical protein